jgi:TonB family protein
MLIQTTRTISKLTLRALFYLALFIIVVFAHLALTGALRAQGVGGGLSLFISGACVLGIVLVSLALADRVSAFVAAWRERRRIAQGLPDGACCVVWENAEPVVEDDEAMPWEVVGPLRARYPALARRMGVEGVAIAEFEVGSNGRAKNIHIVSAWPSDVFFEAAREALLRARFTLKDVHPRFGVSYKMPFVFRISGASKRADHGRHAETLNPAIAAARDAVDRLRSDA